MKRLHIVTHPLYNNYGGILQAKALFNICSYVCHIPTRILQTAAKEPENFFSICKNIFYIMVRLIKKIPKNPHLYFKSHSLTYSSLRGEQSGLDIVSPEDFFCVGSDQVWRCEYARGITSSPYFFLNFVTPEQRMRSVSYAASFGSDEWEGTYEETDECSHLLREFKAVSVREHRGVKICKEVFGVDAVQMPDPTLLLHTEDYVKIIDSEKTWQPESKYVAAYVLDETAGKAELLQEGARTLNIPLQHLMPHATAKKRRDRFPISVPQWLRLIRDCEYFITDSFHGCVFAIIFNKPFVCLGNEGRGNARFDTLLGTFGLEDRLVTDATPEKLLQVLNTPIDWARVNAIHDAERERGINFLKKNLSES